MEMINGRFKTKNLRQKIQEIIFSVFASLLLSTSWSQSILEVKEVTIQNSFDNLTLKTYAVQGEFKVEELISYLQLIENKNNTLELNKQISLNVEQLFNENAHLTGLESKIEYFSPELWLSDWKSEGITINSIQLEKSHLGQTFWTYDYQLNYTKNGKKKSKKMTVIVRFQPEEKSFGTNSKEVWEMKIEKLIIK